MSEAMQVRRAVRGAEGIVLAAIATTSGCAQLPVPRPNTAPVHIPPPVPAGTAAPDGKDGAVVPAEDREVLPPLPPQVGAANAPVEKAAATPILDETLARIDED